MIARALAAIALAVVHRPRVVAAALAAVTVGAALLLPAIQIDPGLESFLPEGLEELELMRNVSGRTGARTLFVILRGAGIDERLPEIAQELEACPLLEDVTARRNELLGSRGARVRRAPLYFLPRDALDRLEDLLTEARFEALRETRDVLTEDPVAGREIAMRDPLGIRWILHELAIRDLPDALDPASPYLVTRDGQKAFLRLRGREEPLNLGYTRALLEDLEARLADEDAELFGGYVTAYEESSRMRRDLKVATISSGVLVFLFLIVSWRSLWAPLWLVLPTASAILWTFGYGGALLGPLSPLAISAAALLMGLGVDFAIHYVTRFAAQRARRGRNEALSVTSRRTGWLLLLSLLTAVGAFSSLSFGRFPGLKSFGLLLALGLCAAWAATMLLLPLLLLVREPRAVARPEGWVVGLFRRLHATRASRPAAWATLAMAAAGWIVLFVRDVPVDADPQRFRAGEGSTPLFEELGFDPSPVIGLVDANRDVEQIQVALTDLERRGVVKHSEGPHKVVPSAAARVRVAAFRGEVSGWVDGALADLERLNLNPKAFRSGLEESAQLFDAEPDENLDAFRVRVGDREYFQVLMFLPLAHRARPDLFDTLSHELGARLVNYYAISDIAGPFLRRELYRASLVAGVAVLAIVLLGFRSLHDGLVALLPVTVGFGITLGTLSLLGIAIHAGNLVAFPFLLGLGIDDGIHMVGNAREKDGDPLSRTGEAVWRTSATSLLAFGSLGFASSPALASLGGVLALGIVVCFTATVVVVPAFAGRTDV